MRRIIDLNEPSATRRRVPIHLVALVDGYTPVPAIVPTITVSINGAAYAAAAGAAPAATGAEGDTYYELDATEAAAAGYVRVLASDGLVVVRDDFAQVEITDGVLVRDIGAAPVTAIQTGLATSAALAAVSAQLPAALVSGRIDASLGATQAASIDAPALTGPAIAAIQNGLALQPNVLDIQTRIPAALDGGWIQAKVMAMDVDTLTAAALAADAGEEIADTMLDRSATGHALDNTLGQRINVPNGAATGTLGSTTFGTTLTETDNDHWKDALLTWTSGPLLGEVKRVFSYDGTTKEITMSTPFTTAPNNGDTFDLIVR